MGVDPYRWQTALLGKLFSGKKFRAELTDLVENMSDAEGIPPYIFDETTLVEKIASS